MDPEQAAEELEDAELVPCVTAAVLEAKRLLETCLAEEIPAVIARDDNCKTGGCAPTARLWVRKEDVARVAALLHKRWNRALENEGIATAAQPSVGESGDPPCPACGTAKPLEGGACTDCGLQLE